MGVQSACRPLLWILYRPYTLRLMIFPWGRTVNQAAGDGSVREKELCLSACMCVCGAKAVWMDGHVTASPHSRMHIFFNLVFFFFQLQRSCRQHCKRIKHIEGSRLHELGCWNVVHTSLGPLLGMLFIVLWAVNGPNQFGWVFPTAASTVKSYHVYKQG